MWLFQPQKGEVMLTIFVSLITLILGYIIGKVVARRSTKSGNQSSFSSFPFFSVDKWIDLVVVTNYWQNNSSPSTYVVALSQLRLFKEATLRLHHSPGINPHNKEKTMSLSRMTIRRLCKVREEVKADGPFWWSTPNLKENYDHSGAMIFSGVNDAEWRDLPEEVIWEAA